MSKYQGRLNIGAWAAQFDNNGYLWISDFNYGGLHRCDTKTGQITLEHIFDLQHCIRSEMHSSILFKGDDLILTPLRDNYLRIYNSSRRTEFKIMMPEEKKEYNTIVFDGSVYYFSSKITAYKFDYDNMRFAEDVILTEAMNGIKCDSKSSLGVGTGDTLTIWNKSTNLLADIDVKANNIKIIEIKKGIDNIYNVFHLDGRYWFLCQDRGDVISRDESSDIYTEYSTSSFEFVDGRNFLPYAGMVKFGKTILLPNYYGRYFMKINEHEKRIERLFGDEESGSIVGLTYGASYKTVLEYNDCLYCIPQRRNNIVKCDKNLKVVDCIPMSAEIDDDYFERIIMGADSLIHNEQEGAINIENYVKYLCADNK